MIYKNVLITGCNRGIGLELVKKLAGSSIPPKNIIATYRKIDSSTELHNIAKLYPEVKLLKIDLKNEEEYTPFKEEVSRIVGNDGLNLLINNAGISPKFTSINLVTWSQMQETLLINTIAPGFITKTLLPLLQTASSNWKGNDMGVNRAAIINVSSMLGSMEMNETAALNAITRSLSIDLKDKKILVVSLHPGWVKTDMGGKNAILTTEESVSNILKTLQSLEERHTGQFVQYDSKLIPW